jgi:hypothetical protein
VVAGPALCCQTSLMGFAGQFLDAVCWHPTGLMGVAGPPLGLYACNLQVAGLPLGLYVGDLRVLSGVAGPPLELHVGDLQVL